MDIDKVVERYHERAIKLLKQIAQEVEVSYPNLSVSGPVTLQDSWSIIVRPKGADETIDITLQVCDSEECDGTENGVNFSISVVTEGGKILGGLTPYNYTDSVWVSRDDEEAVETRFNLLRSQALDYDFGWLITRKGG